MSIFANVQFLIKQLQATITSDCNIWDSIAIIVALDSLYNNFDITNKSILKQDDKKIDKTQKILASAKV